MAKIIRFRCMSMSQEGWYYTIKVTDAGALCDCGDPAKSWCSHIEATLVAGERAMVEDGHGKRADAAMALVIGKLQAPPDWRGAWRSKMRWRGLVAGPIRERRQSHIGEHGLPVVCFTGPMEIPRGVLLEAAIAAGWEAIDTVHSATDVLVAADVHGTSKKLSFARRHGIPIVSLNEWMELLHDGEVPMNDKDKGA